MLCLNFTDVDVRIAKSTDMWETSHTFFRSSGAAGAQVPYKHKVVGSNPISTTRKTAGQSLFRLACFRLKTLRGYVWGYSLEKALQY